MKWESYVRKVGGTFYIALPSDYVKAHKIDRDDLLFFNLNSDGTITICTTDPEVRVK